MGITRNYPCASDAVPLQRPQGAENDTRVSRAPLKKDRRLRGCITQPAPPERARRKANFFAESGREGGFCLNEKRGLETMTDEDFVARLQALEAKGSDGLPAMRELLRGQMPRLIALAARGVHRTPRKPTIKQLALPGMEFPTWWPQKAWEGYLAMRKAKKTTPTERAVELLIIALTGLRAAGNDPGAVLDRSTVNFWTDVYPLRGFTPAIVAGPFEDTNASGWTGRLEIFHGISSDGDIPPGSWSPRWGEKPGQPGSRVPQIAWTRFDQKYPGRRAAS